MNIDETLSYIHAVCWKGSIPGLERSRALLALCVALNLSGLIVFKYAGFLVENCNAIFKTAFAVPQISLPIGISFYTFQALSYSVDVYRKDVAAQRSYWKLLLYVSMFPQLIAGPIVRYVDVAAQIDARELDSENIFRGVTRFCIGLGKKVLLADHIGQVADQLLGGSFAGATSVGILLAGLGDDVVVSAALLRAGSLLACLVCLLEKIETQDLVEIVQQILLRRVVRLILENIVERRDAERGVEIVAQRLIELLSQRRDGLIVDRIIGWLERGNLRNQLLIRAHRVIEVFPGKDEVLAVVALQAEQAVCQRVIALLLQKRNRQKFALGFGHLAGRGV